MKTTSILSYSSYVFVLVFCCLFSARTLLIKKRESSKSWQDAIVSLLPMVSVMAVTLFYLFTMRSLSGNYAVYTTFAMSPAVLSRPQGSRARLYFTLCVTCLTLAAVAAALLGLLKTELASAAMVCMAAVPVACAGSAMWNVGGVMRKFDGALSIRETLEEFACIFYSSLLLFLLCIGRLIADRVEPAFAIGNFVLVLLVFGLAAASFRRRRTGKVFLVRKDREEALMEYHRLCTSLEKKDSYKTSASYDNLYTRLKAHFEKNTPFLNPDLTLNDVAKALLTNKMYLSRVINEYAGRNFCQFVNYYRVRYAVRLFRNNNSYKIMDMATKSGFNTVHSFTMAFRLYMNMSPSQWCRINKGKQGTDDLPGLNVK